MGIYFLGLDYGTGGAKACITDEELNIIAYSFQEYPIITNKPGWSEHNADDYWKITCECIKECVEISRINVGKIAGISLSCAMPSLVMIDKMGKVINEAYNLMDRRATRQANLVKDIIGEDRYFELNANRLDDHPGIVNLLWEKENRPESYKRIYKVLSIAGFVKFKLTGLYNENYSVATFLGAYDIRRNKFDIEMIDQLGLNTDFFPEVTPCEAIFGTVNRIGAEEAGLEEGIPVVSGQVDACAGWLGGGATNVGDIQMNLGTCGNFGIVNERNIFENTMINCAYTVNSEKTYVVIPTTTTGGQLIRYMRDNFSPLEMAIEKEAGIDSYDLLNLEAEKIPAGSEGLVVLPYLMGERTPIWDVEARGLIIGLSLNHSRAHVVRAMMEGVAYALYNSFELLKDKFQSINYPIVLNEGGAKSVLWRRIITDVFDTPTVLLKNRVGAPYGNCILVGKACGRYKDFAIAKEKAQYIDLMEPDKSVHRMYMDYYELYKQTYKSNKSGFRDLAVLREKYLV